MTSTHYPTVLFDWGDTVMKDDPASSVPMVDGKPSRRFRGSILCSPIYNPAGGALCWRPAPPSRTRGKSAALDAPLWTSISPAFSASRTQDCQKGRPFTTIYWTASDIPASEALMVGDSFEKGCVGSQPGWYMPYGSIPGQRKFKAVFHTPRPPMRELLSFFKSLDRITMPINPESKRSWYQPVLRFVYQ
jgi:hypothetical protein